MAELAFSFDGEGLSSLSKLLSLLGKATGWEGLLLVSDLGGSCSFFVATPGLMLLVASRKWVPESTVSLITDRLGGECWCSSPEDREERLVLGAGLVVVWKTWLLSSGEGWRGSSLDLEECMGLIRDWGTAGSNPVPKLCKDALPALLGCSMRRRRRRMAMLSSEMTTKISQ